MNVVLMFPFVYRYVACIELIYKGYVFVFVYDMCTSYVIDREKELDTYLIVNINQNIHETNLKYTLYIFNVPSQINPPPLLAAFILEQLIGRGPRTDTNNFVCPHSTNELPVDCDNIDLDKCI